jgi:chaperone required for assembly of F1-ATPase
VSRSDEEAAGRQGQERASLPKRFYSAATITREPQQQAAGAAWRVLLDGKPIRTPAKRDFVLPTRQLAAAIAAEWQAQGEEVDPASMPLTRLANSAIDGVSAREAAVRADILKYLASDLLCYRAPEPSELVRRQTASWDPILDWWQAAFGVRLAVTRGIVPVSQPELRSSALTGWLAGLDSFQLAAVHATTTLLGSAVLSLALAHGRLDCAGAWAAAHIDEDFQSERWGVDSVAKARRDRHWQELQAARRLFELAREH